ncbi:hypothetical protein E2P86_02480 [Sphingobacterium psychroaquaticum]|uniref:fimbrial biogenesis chaperone n=1 Tax=Sphingobacterium psychroaquaticum TaxID=561061 RepID=UPI00106CFC8D|nr:hypothetical protein [Sphingobacterium psychroaquaticum]QBQ40077.1 hypothetical protein E2P86_02480 [Sphingobacterium psychroaquaticum]
MKKIATVLFFLLISLSTFAQTGLSVGPPRLYFVSNSGQNQSLSVEVTNPSKDYTLELAASMEDWEYNEYGDNILKPKGTLKTSCANWVSVSEPFFALKPGESKRLQVNIMVPPNVVYQDSLPVHTAMLFISQLNPKEGNQREGANIRIAVRSGVKIYHRFTGMDKPDLEITDFKYLAPDSVNKYIELSYDVTGNVWLEGQMRVEFINQETGKKTLLDNLAFYALPGDHRKQYVQVPKDLAKGNYVASAMLFYGNQQQVKAAELEFKHEVSE